MAQTAATLAAVGALWFGGVLIDVKVRSHMLPENVAAALAPLLQLAALCARLLPGLHGMSSRAVAQETQEAEPASPSVAAERQD